MIKVIHKYQRSIITYLIMFLVFAAMLGFGVDFGTGGQRDAAITIDEHTVSYSDFYRQRQDLQDQYRRQYGALYDQLADTKGWNINQQTVDRIIPSYLMIRLAENFDMHVGDGELRKTITDQFGGAFNPAIYSAYLQSVRQTAEEFEAQLAKRALVAQLEAFVSDMSRASTEEARDLLERDETSYTADYIELDPAAFLEKAEAPNEETLKEYYTQNETEYEKPARISYQYVVFDPKEHLDIVEVFDEDIEIYYTEHESEFAVPARAQASYIRLSIPPDADDAAREEIKLKAESVQAEAMAGEDFASLASAYSDDLETKFKGGSLGWLQPGKYDKALENAALNLGKEGVAELAAGPKAFYVVKVEKYEPRRTKELKEVKAQISNILKNKEAPAWTFETATKFHEDFASSGKPLAEFAKEKQLTLAATDGLLEADRDSDPALTGLTAKVMKNPDLKTQLVELGDKTVVVEVQEYKEAQYPGLENVKEEVIADYRKKRSVELARQAAADLIEEIKRSSEANLAAAAEKSGYEVKEAKDVKPTSAPVAPFYTPEMKEALFSTTRKMTKPKASFEYSGKFYVFQVKDIKKPDISKMEDKLEEYRERASMTNSNVMMMSLINAEKAKADIQIAPSLID